jgi:hypothetical protein
VGDFYDFYTIQSVCGGGGDFGVKIIYLNVIYGFLRVANVYVQSIFNAEFLWLSSETIC